MKKLRILLLAAIPMAACGQAMVEYGLGAAAAGTAGAGAQGAAKGLAGILTNLSKTLDGTKEAQPAAVSGGVQAKQAAPKPAATAATGTENAEKAKPAEPPKPAVIYEDPAGIAKGMERVELLSRFGEPSMKITSGAGRESLSYEAKDRRVEVEMRDGKVYSVQSKNKPKRTAVVLLQ